MIELVRLGKGLEWIRGELSTIVCDERVWNSVSDKVLFSSLDDSRGLNSWEFVEFIKVTVVVNCNQICKTIQFKQVLGDKLPW